MLNHIISVSVFHENTGVSRDGLCQELFLFRTRSINALLHDGAAVHITCYPRTISYHLIIDDLIVDRKPRDKDLLNYVIRIY